MTSSKPSVIDANDCRNWLATTSEPGRSLLGFKETNIAAALGAVENVAPSRPAKAPQHHPTRARQQRN